MAKKQLYILCDLEGASQISPENRKAMHYGSEQWQQEGRRYITSDLKAVCEAANEFGIDEIIINDDHDSGHREPNALVKELPGNVRVLPRPHLPGTPRRKTRPDLFVIIIVGQHAMYGSGGFAPHTIQSPPIGGVTVNGLALGEIGIELALFMGVKFLAIVGEEALGELDRKYLRFAEEFERSLIHQGSAERSVEETLDLGWKILGGVPETEFRRIRREFIDKYRSKSAATAEEL